MRAVQAGADVILLPPDPEVAVQSLVRAVREGRSDRGAPRRVGAAHPRGQGAAGPATAAPGRAGGRGRAVARPEDVERALEIARRSITVVRNEGGVLPLRAEQPLRLLHLVLSSDAAQPTPSRASRRPSWPRGASRRDASPRPRGRPRRRVDASSLARAGEFTPRAGLGLRARRRRPRARRTCRRATRALLRRAAARRAGRWSSSRSAARTCCGSSRELPAYVCAYGCAPSRASARRWRRSSGSMLSTGKLPVTLPGLYPYGARPRACRGTR